MLWVCLLMAFVSPEVDWDALVTARIARQSKHLDHAYWQDAARSRAAREAYLLTLGQIGNPADAIHITAAFANPELQAQAILAYGELEQATIKPLLDWIPKVKAENQHLLLEAMSKLAGEADHGSVITAWETSSSQAKDQALFYLWRLKPKPLTKRVLTNLKATKTPTLHGHVFYLYRSRTKVAESLLVRVLDIYVKKTQTFIFASRIQTEGLTPELKQRFIAMTRHEDWRIRVQGINGLKRLKAGTVSLWEMLLEDVNPNVRRLAMTSLLKTGDPLAKRYLNADRFHSPSLLQTALTSASDAQWETLWPFLANWGASKNLWQQQQWLRFQSRSKEKGVIASLKQRVLELDSPQTVLALGALMKRDPSLARDLAPALMKREDPFVLNAVLTAISDEARDKWAVPFEQVKTLAHRNYRENIFQHTYIQGLEKWLTPEARHQELIKLAKHPDYLVRYNAVKAMKKPGKSDWERVFSRTWNTPVPKPIAKLAADLFHTNKIWTWTLETTKGKIKIKLAPHLAPITCANIAFLSNRGYFVGLAVHRVVGNFVVQAGDGRGDGSGGPGYSIPCEINELRPQRGSVGMALLSKDSGGSQFFICHSAQPHLDGGYTIFGRVVAGMEIVDKIEEGDVILWAKIGLEAGPEAGLQTPNL